MNIYDSVLDRYSDGAKKRQDALCCPIDYDRELLGLLPQEIIEKDYGCGDPSRYVRPGDTVLDLGSGGGKICYMAAQLVGEKGQVIGVDMNDDMLALARKYRQEMVDKLGNDRVRFLKGFIQDLALDLEAVEKYVAANPVSNVEQMQALEKFKSEQRASNPLIPDNSVDLVISNCVLNLVSDEQKGALVKEIFRVLKPGGRVAISDIVSDENIPMHMKEDPALWSGCLSGAFHESEFLQEFVNAGFVAAGYDKWDAQPWQIIEGIEFRSVTLTAHKNDQGPCLDYGHAVIYRGPYSAINDDEGHVFYRGERMAVCERTYKLLTEGPYQDDFIGITPAERKEPVTWCAPSGTKRPAAETKGGVHNAACCGEPGSCC